MMPLAEIILICMNISETLIIQKLIHVVQSGSERRYQNVSR